jgi:hypothetical protein
MSEIKLIRKSSKEWKQEPQHKDVTILDPDGWDRTNLEASMEEKITEDEFINRLNRSTCMLMS